MNSSVRDAIVGELDNLDDAQLRQVLGSVRAAKSQRARRGTVADLVREFGGSIPPDELDRMEGAIEADCERIETD